MWLENGRNLTVLIQLTDALGTLVDFYKDFADALSLLDEVILTEIYPARELPIEGVTSELIYNNLRPGIEKQIINKADVLQFVKEHSFDVLIVLGAGDLDNQVPEITKLLNSKL